MIHEASVPAMSTHSDAAAEADLLARLRAGDETAFEAVLDRHHQSLVRLATLFVSDTGAAEEVAQETWVAVLKGLPAFEGRSTFKTWLFRILVNRARTRGVRDKRMVPLPDEGDGGETAGWFTSSGSWAQLPVRWAADTPEDLVLHAETHAALESAIAALPPVQRAVITMRDVEGLPAEDVCNVLELTETNQRVLLHRARTRVRAALSAHVGER